MKNRKFEPEKVPKEPPEKFPGLFFLNDSRRIAQGMEGAGLEKRWYLGNFDKRRIDTIRKAAEARIQQVLASEEMPEAKQIAHRTAAHLEEKFYPHRANFQQRKKDNESRMKDYVKFSGSMMRGMPWPIDIEMQPVVNGINQLSFAFIRGNCGGHMEPGQITSWEGDGEIPTITKLEFERFSKDFRKLWVIEQVGNNRVRIYRHPTLLEPEQKPMQITFLEEENVQYKPGYIILGIDKTSKDGDLFLKALTELNEKYGFERPQLRSSDEGETSENDPVSHFYFNIWPSKPQNVLPSYNQGIMDKKEAEDFEKRKRKYLKDLIDLTKKFKKEAKNSNTQS